MCVCVCVCMCANTSTCFLNGQLTWYIFTEYVELVKNISGAVAVSFVGVAVIFVVVFIFVVVGCIATHIILQFINST